MAWRGRYFQLEHRREGLGLVGQKITVRQKLDETMQLVSRGRRLSWQELPERPKAVCRSVGKDAEPKRAVGEGRPWKPPADHPWRRPYQRPRLALAATESG